MQHHKQLALFFNFEREGLPSDVAYVHTRGVMEHLCIDQFDSPGPGHSTGCPMCYGTAFRTKETEYAPKGPLAWSCGATANRLMLSASQSGATTISATEIENYQPAAPAAYQPVNYNC